MQRSVSERIWVARHNKYYTSLVDMNKRKENKMKEPAAAMPAGTVFVCAECGRETRTETPGVPPGWVVFRPPERPAWCLCSQACANGGQPWS